jgi:hypothetical protein
MGFEKLQTLCSLGKVMCEHYIDLTAVCKRQGEHQSRTTIKNGLLSNCDYCQSGTTVKNGLL